MGGKRYEVLASLLLIALIEQLVGCVGSVGSGNATASKDSHSTTGAPMVCILASCVRTQLDKAIEKSTEKNVPEEKRSVAVERAVRLEKMLNGVKILWVDDSPENNDAERNLFVSLGTRVNLARTTEAAISSLKTPSYDLVISDMRRGGDETAGLQLLSEIRKLGKPTPVIFYAAGFDPGRGVPPYAFGMTNRPDELLHLVLDVIERLRS